MGVWHAQMGQNHGNQILFFIFSCARGRSGKLGTVVEEASVVKVGEREICESKHEYLGGVERLFFWKNLLDRKIVSSEASS